MVSASSLRSLAGKLMLLVMECVSSLRSLAGKMMLPVMELGKVYRQSNHQSDRQHVVAQQPRPQAQTKW